MNRSVHLISLGPYWIRINKNKTIIRRIFTKVALIVSMYQKRFWVQTKTTTTTTTWMFYSMFVFSIHRIEATNVTNIKRVVVVTVPGRCSCRSFWANVRNKSYHSDAEHVSSSSSGENPARKRPTIICLHWPQQECKPIKRIFLVQSRPHKNRMKAISIKGKCLWP